MLYKKKTQKHIFQLLGILIAFGMVFPMGCVESEDYPVSIQRTKERFTTISKALQHAVDGDVILIDEGIVHDSIQINKAVTLKGAGKEKTIIQGNGSKDVITILQNNVTILDCMIQDPGNRTYPEIDAAIEIKADYITFSNVTIDGANYGIYSYQHHFINLEYVKVTNCTERGISLYSAENVTISDCIIDQTAYGIYWMEIVDSSIQSSVFDENSATAVYLGGASHSNMISNNTFRNNEYGLHLKSSSGNTVVQNLFLSNNRGIYICCGADENLIYKNGFISNNEHAYGYPINFFDNGAIGNYWDDYQGKDLDADGIGDTPYNATVSEGYGVSNIDNYPLMTLSI